MYYVYILEQSNNSFYTGQTTDLVARIKKHEKGDVLATKGSRPLKLVHYSAFNSKKKALAFEKYLKTGSGQAFRNNHFV